MHVVDFLLQTSKSYDHRGAHLEQAVLFIHVIHPPIDGS